MHLVGIYILEYYYVARTYEHYIYRELYYDEIKDDGLRSYQAVEFGTSPCVLEEDGCVFVVLP